MVDKYSVLSNCDIEHEIGKNILIYPFKRDNIRGASYNLTVSKLAWDVQNGQSIYDSGKNKVEIKPGTTAAIQTHEAIWISSKITGSYHSKVKYVTQGLSHIGTTLDPWYLGTSLITVHNYGSKIISWTPEKETFVSLVFYYLATESTIDPVGNNSPGRRDLLSPFDVTPEEKEWLDKSFRNDKNSLYSMLEKDSTDFQEILKSREKEQHNKAKNKAIKKKQLYGILGISLWIVCCVVAIYLQIKKVEYDSKEWYPWVVNGVNLIVSVLPSSLGAYLLQEVFKD